MRDGFNEQPKSPFVLGESFVFALSLGDVIKEYGNFSLARFSNSKRIHVIPPLQVGGDVFKPCRLACQGYLPVNFEPVLLMLGSNLTHSFATRVFNSGLFLKRRVNFKKAIVNRFIAFVKYHFDGAKAFVNRIEQKAVFSFRPLASFSLYSEFLVCNQELAGALCDALLQGISRVNQCFFGFLSSGDVLQEG